MKKLLLLLATAFIITSCTDPTVPRPPEGELTTDYAKIALHYTNGKAIPFTPAKPNYGQKCYAIWMRNEALNYTKNIYLCNILKVKNACPYWAATAKPFTDQTEIDAVTRATHQNSTGKNVDFSIGVLKIAGSKIKQFDLYFELARSFEANDWFTDQPSIVYKTSVDLDKLKDEYTLEPIGWIAHENKIKPGVTIEGFTLNKLDSRMEYITHKIGKTGGVSSLLDTENAGTLVVGSIKLNIVYN